MAALTVVLVEAHEQEFVRLVVAQAHARHDVWLQSLSTTGPNRLDDGGSLLLGVTEEPPPPLALARFGEGLGCANISEVRVLW